ncbi:tyrosine-type recombinase/integrase [Streptomyces sp. NPDC006514]|uniref:tyrosine-type recombinase/integrase n=1 Tax=Streptomyces sp. NPDC006514 TaxID=3154308 RepID=UPI0033B61973
MPSPNGTCTSRSSADASPVDQLLRHFAASDLYAQGMNVVAIQELLSYRWINTTMIYVHLNKTHIEDAWTSAGQRAASRFTG